MSKPRYPIPDDTIAAQRAAADPRVSAWVGANAGSGKTHVLASRVIRLLLDGAEPQKILCLTYTKAAAANMATRVFDTLGRWTTLDDAALGEEIAALDGAAVPRERLAQARRLFARALETPGGLKIQTIHAFCEAVLHQFPLEANIAGHFEMLDGPMEAALMGEARRDMLTGVTRGGHLEATFAAVMAHGRETGLDRLMREIVSNRDAIAAFIAEAGGPQGLWPALADDFGFDEKDTPERIATAAWPVPGFEPNVVAALDDWAFQNGATRARDSCLYAANIACSESDPVRRLRAFAAAVLGSKGDPYKPTWLFPKKMLAAFPELEDRYVAAADHVARAADRLKLLAMLEATRHALTLADWMIGRYAALKSARGFLDFNDLIVKTSNLLQRHDAGAWVQYKLDQGIDHVLVDEAQDTSPGQWSVVAGMTAEFFAGEGARSNIMRTVFAVGDEKQSIYSFQGAEPGAFANQREAFRQRIEGAGLSLVRKSLPRSFRSTPDVLAAVDLVFSDPEARRGLTSEEEVAHLPIRRSDPGLVEVWPRLTPEIAEEPDDWRLPIDHTAAPAVVLADGIARRIRDWITSGEIIEGKGRRVAAGDILVLVRKRDRFIHALARKLKELDVAVAGADRLSLPEHIAIQDLIALGRFVQQPHDDLSLAALLKSPVFGLDDDALMEIALDRAPSQRLWDRLRASGRHDVRFAHAAEQLERWRREAGYRPAADFYANVLARDGVRALMIARLGPEAGEILDEFMGFALAQDRTGLNDMESLLATLETSPPVIKREMEAGRDEVRIMTVHAAKGLEAPIVFLVDGGAQPVHSSHMPALVRYDRSLRAQSGVPGFLWRGSSELKNTITETIGEELKQRAEEEYRRLLYVAMTRAEDRLIVCGYQKAATAREGNMRWHELVTAGLTGAEETERVADEVSGTELLRFRITRAQGRAVETPDAAMPVTRQPMPFDPAFKPPAPDQLPRPLSPSGAALLIETGEGSEAIDASVRASPVLDATDEPSLAIRRGLAVHTLMHMLPAIAQPERREIARRWLERQSVGWPDGEAERLLDTVFGVLEDPAFAAVFAEGSRAEVPVTGQVVVRGRKHPVSGIIDRLAVAQDTVLVADYKTNRPPASSAADVHKAYVLQMALYRALLQPLYPEHRIRCALIYTEAQRLIEIPVDRMNESLAILASETMM